jgi:uncharacterized membrane protein
MLPPHAGPLKATTDATVVGSAFLGWMKVIPWPEFAAAAALIYTVLRIAELIVGWFRKRG